MEKLDIGTVIQDAISRFSQNRSGDKPPVFVTLAPAMTQVPWKNQTAEGFIRRFIYETLLTSDPDAPIEVSLRRRSCLNDLNAFIGIKPSYWIQLRVTGRGIRVGEKLIDELFGELGFRVEEWVGVDGSETRLGIFAHHRCAQTDDGFLSGVGAPQTEMRSLAADRRWNSRCKYAFA